MITTSTLDSFWKDYAPHAVGLDDVFHRLESMTHHNVKYPPYNLIKHDGSNYEIEIALAGFKQEEIEVSTESNILRVASKTKDTNPERKYLHQGLSKRAFNSSWQMGDDVRVRNVNFEDGLLKISLEKIIPDHQKRTVYEIKKAEIDAYLDEPSY